MSENTKKLLSISAFAIAVVVLAIMAWRTMGEDEAVRIANTRVLMDVNTGELVRIPTEELKPFPMTNPDTGEATLYPTEVCYWGEECKKNGGTRVILNRYLEDKEGPTKCPVCGHMVLPHNPLPPGYTPEY